MGGLRKLHAGDVCDLYRRHAGAVRVSAVLPGFWSKDEILHAAHGWGVSQGPFYLGVVGALLTAFYMTRQMCYVFLGQRRLAEASVSPAAVAAHDIPAEQLEPVVSARTGEVCIIEHPHESPAVMTQPLVVLAVFQCCWDLSERRRGRGSRVSWRARARVWILDGLASRACCR